MLDPRGMTERPALRVGATSQPGAHVMLCRVRTPELHGPHPVQYSHPGPNGAKPWGLWPSPGPWAVQPTFQESGMPSPLVTIQSYARPLLGTLPGIIHPLGCKGQPEASAQQLCSSSGFIGPPAVGTREFLGRGDSVGSKMWRGPSQERRGSVT